MQSWLYINRLKTVIMMYYEYFINIYENERVTCLIICLSVKTDSQRETITDLQTVDDSDKIPQNWLNFLRHFETSCVRADSLPNLLSQLLEQMWKLTELLSCVISLRNWLWLHWLNNNMAGPSKPLVSEEKRLATCHWIQAYLVCILTNIEMSALFRHYHKDLRHKQQFIWGLPSNFLLLVHKWQRKEPDLRPNILS